MHVDLHLTLLAASALSGTAVAVPQTSSADPSATPSPGKDAFCISSPTDFYTQNSRFTTFVNQFYIKKDVSAAFHEYVASDYIQHNPFIGQGAATAVQALNQFFPALNITILRYGMDKDLGWIHLKIDGSSSDKQPIAVVDIYRWNGSCVAEHWDVIQTRPQNATNPLALF